MHLVTLYHTQHKHYEAERTLRRLLAMHKNVLFWQLDLYIADILPFLLQSFPTKADTMKRQCFLRRH